MARLGQCKIFSPCAAVRCIEIDRQYQYSILVVQQLQLATLNMTHHQPRHINTSLSLSPKSSTSSIRVSLVSFESLSSISSSCSRVWSFSSTLFPAELFGSDEASPARVLFTRRTSPSVRFIAFCVNVFLRCVVPNTFLGACVCTLCFLFQIRRLWVAPLCCVRCLGSACCFAKHYHIKRSLAEAPIERLMTRGKRVNFLLASVKKSVLTFYSRLHETHWHDTKNMAHGRTYNLLHFLFMRS